jgi:hypothetical protein
MPRVRSVLAPVLVAALLTMLAAPAFCAPSRHAMPCCERNRTCGDSLGRPACCAVATPAAPASTPSGTADSRLPVFMALDVTPPVAGPCVLAASGCAAASATRADSPPLYLMHASLLC